MTTSWVYKDLALNQEIVLAHEVADNAVYDNRTGVPDGREGRVVFVIRERVDSERGGLWAIGIDGTPPAAGIVGPGM